MDGLFLPTTENPNQPFYLVEVQFQPDEVFYYRLFSELFLYLKQYRLTSPWQVVVIYPTRGVEREESLHFNEILELNRVRRIYLDELKEETSSSLGVKVVKLIVEAEDNIGEKAKELVEQARQQLTDEAVKRNLIDLIETIIVYKLPNKSREEIEAMFGLSELKQTKVYQEAFEEGKLKGELKGELRGELKAKLETIPRMIQFGLEEEEIARLLDLPLRLVQGEVERLQ